MGYDNLDPNYGAGCNTAVEKMVSMPSLKQRLEQAVKAAEQRLAEAKEAREILDRNPDLERLLNLMQKGHF